MKTKLAVAVAATGWASISFLHPGAVAQNLPTSQAAFEHSLKPIPRALQGGNQGLPVAGSMARSDPGAAIAPPARNPYEGDISRQGPRGKVGTATVSAAHPHSASAPVDTTVKPSISVQTIQFEFGSAKLKPQSVDTLRNLGDALNQGLSDQKLFVIEGHTDAVGSRSYNLELSRSRAQAVKDFLVNEMGVDAARLEVVGKGSAEPVNRRNPYASENRRVIVVNEAS